MSLPLLIGIDVGGTKIAGVAACDGVVLAERRQLRSARPLEEQVVALARQLVDESPEPPAAIGLAVPGQVHAATGTMELAVNLDARPVPIGALVSEAVGVVCHVEHDARAVAAWLRERDDVPPDFAFVSVGTGISAGVVSGDRIVRGADGLAGEIGHVLADPGGVRCACGSTGCLETVAAGPAIARIARRPSTADVYLAASGGDELAARTVAAAATHLAAAVRGLALMFGLSRIFVGGGVTLAGTAFSEPLRRALERQALESPLSARILPPAAVEVLDDHRPIGALGAASVARLAVERAHAPAEEVRRR